MLAAALLVGIIIGFLIRPQYGERHERREIH